MNIDTDIPPVKIAQWLSIALAQRERAAKQASVDFGSDSPIPLTLTAEASDIRALMTSLTKLAATAPHSLNQQGKTR